ncbi:MAG: hypothetical protein R3D59_03820 [Paracoccaceae bacterium]
MKRLFDITRYPALLIFVFAGVALVVVAYASFNLLSMSMANLDFLRRDGLVAVTSGGLVQFLEILVTATVALAFFLIYKICESELVIRYRRWLQR